MRLRTRATIAHGGQAGIEAATYLWGKREYLFLVFSQPWIDEWKPLISIRQSLIQLIKTRLTEH